MALGEINSGTTIELTQEQLNNIIKQTLLAAHPVGSIYQSLDSTSPEILFGGKWQTINGAFLFSTDGNHTVGSTGGEFTHTLTVSEMPNHSHNMAVSGYSGWGPRTITGYVLRFDSSVLENTSSGTVTLSHVANAALNIQSAGASQAHNNMPPYLTVYTWKRTA